MTPRSPAKGAKKGPMKEPALIVNADDLGRTEGINAGIFEAHEKGIVTSATLMVGYAASVTAGKALVDHPRLGVGLHVTLSGHVPLLPPEQVPSLVGADGRFPPKPAGHRNPEPAEVLAEIRAQVARFRELTGGPPTHLDSHHHSQRLPAVFEALLTVAREEGLPVRRTGPAGSFSAGAAGVLTTDAFDETFTDEGATLEHLLQVLGSLPPGLTELMCHPARVDEELRASSGYTSEREVELAALSHPEALAAVEEHGIRLLTFRDLKR